VGEEGESRGRDDRKAAIKTGRSLLVLLKLVVKNIKAWCVFFLVFFFSQTAVSFYNSS